MIEVIQLREESHARADPRPTGSLCRPCHGRPASVCLLCIQFGAIPAAGNKSNNNNNQKCKRSDAAPLVACGPCITPPRRLGRRARPPVGRHLLLSAVSSLRLFHSQRGRPFLGRDLAAVDVDGEI